ncbi:heme exporter protein CcmD [Marinomonas algarum]|uniref:Heme exporter protein D n=1 Tax=Marinomonas algarum TaxID=2883105 RepID=A0A9X1LET5_9GAMM|nr:heme exporter protein CcmD [Marinomonas algarum]MCB5161996.1 heme exporter protein CcmD [Marinomonas algarum]
MAFDTVSAFLQMGKHGLYVWSSYGISVVALGWLIHHTLASRRRAQIRLSKRFKRGV